MVIERGLFYQEKNSAMLNASTKPTADKQES
jgi:hypothetical protein